MKFLCLRKTELYLNKITKFTILSSSYCFEWIFGSRKRPKNCYRKRFSTQSNRKPTKQEIEDLIFANKIVKHSKSNTIVLAKTTLIGSGVGMTSRVDALKFAITKAQTFGFDTKGAVMASDAFFPFADLLKIAHNVGIEAVIEPVALLKTKILLIFAQ